MQPFSDDKMKPYGTFVYFTDIPVNVWPISMTSMSAVIMNNKFNINQYDENEQIRSRFIVTA